jgi:hypothetical protein
MFNMETEDRNKNVTESVVLEYLFLVRSVL